MTGECAGFCEIRLRNGGLSSDSDFIEAGLNEGAVGDIGHVENFSGRRRQLAHPLSRHRHE
jgi:hypothetical protein